MNFLEGYSPFGLASVVTGNASLVKSWTLTHAYVTMATGVRSAQTHAPEELRDRVTTTECVIASQGSVSVMLITKEHWTVASALQDGLGPTVPLPLCH